METKGRIRFDKCLHAKRRMLFVFTSFYYNLSCFSKANCNGFHLFLALKTPDRLGIKAESVPGTCTQEILLGWGMGGYQSGFSFS